MTQALLLSQITDVISIHTFLAEGDFSFVYSDAAVEISIHTFLAEGDRSVNYAAKMYSDFNPHLPCGR